MVSWREGQDGHGRGRGRTMSPVKAVMVELHLMIVSGVRMGRQLVVLSSVDMFFACARKFGVDELCCTTLEVPDQ